MRKHALIILSFLITFAAALLLPAAEVPAGREPAAGKGPASREGRRRRPPRSPDRYRRGAGIWEVFSRLTEKEKQELLKLQRSDPEKFRTLMQNKADALYQARLERQRYLRQLAKEYRESKDETAKNAIRNKLRAALEEDFRQRLARARRNIEAGKRRLAAMEADLANREKNLDLVVNAATEKFLSGKFGNHRNRQGRPRQPVKANAPKPAAPAGN